MPAGQLRLSARAGVVPVLYVINDSDGSNFWKSIWLARHGSTPTELTETRLNTFTFAQQFSNPQLSPDRTQVVYGTVPQGGSLNAVFVAYVDDVLAPVMIATYPNATGGGTNTGMQPFWHPDGTQVIYAETVASGDTSQHLRRVDADGSNDVSLYVNNRSADGFLMMPAYNFDGSRIAFYKQTGAAETIWTMLADGSGASSFDSRSVSAIQKGGLAWANTSDALAWCDTGGVYKMADGDGSGIVTLWTDPNPLWRNTRFSWLPDDSGIVVARRIPADPDPEYVLTVIDTGGGGITDLSPERRTRAFSSAELPYVFAGRVWWAYTDPAGLVDTVIYSVNTTGGDLTTEVTIEDVTGVQEFVGFDGREF